MTLNSRFDRYPRTACIYCGTIQASALEGEISFHAYSVIPGVASIRLVLYYLSVRRRHGKHPPLRSFTTISYLQLCPLRMYGVSTHYLSRFVY